MKRLSAILIFVMSALPTMTLHAQEAILGVEFDTYFDNREYSGNEFGEPRTLFTGRLTPYAGVQWDEHNRLVAGVELLRHFGDNTGEGDPLMSDIKPRMYYRFSNRGVEAFAGIFSFEELSTDNYSRAIFSDEMRFYHSSIAGFLGRYTSQQRENTFVELALHWEGMYSAGTREQFRIVSAGRYDLGKRFYLGSGMSMFHFANSEVIKNVTDNIIVNPFVGKEFAAWCDIDLKLGVLAAPQRGREVGEGNWQMPLGGHFDISLRKWGVKIENNLYVGENLQPLRNAISGTIDGVDMTYGGEGLYAGESFFATTKRVYNRTWLGYDRTFFGDTLALKAGMVFHYDGTALGTQQVVQLSVALEKLLSFKKK